MVVLLRFHHKRRHDFPPPSLILPPPLPLSLTGLLLLLLIIHTNGNGMKVRRSFRVLCRSSLSVATATVHAVRAGTPPQDILADAPDSGYTGGSSSRHGSSSASANRRRRVGAGGVGEGQQYPALVERALETLLKVK